MTTQPISLDLKTKLRSPKVGDYGLEVWGDNNSQALEHARHPDFLTNSAETIDNGEWTDTICLFCLSSVDSAFIC
jgi:hypothetical protein